MEPTPEPRPWLTTLRLVAVLAFGVVAVVLRADPRVVAVIGVMVCAVLRWRGPLPTIVIGGRPPPGE